jgi:outer membrane protein assembly factor BamB
VTARLRFFAACLLLSCLSAAHADNWPAWRGPESNGHCKERDLPTSWSPTDNVLWKIKLPAPGDSTPAIWGERLFLTQASDKGHKRSLLCLNRKDGSTRWEKSVTYAEKEPTHQDNHYCSASPATDGEVVVAWFGSAGMGCWDMDGKQLWFRDLGKATHIWGNASSPVIHGDRVFLAFGPGLRTFLLAVDRKTGRDLWRVEETPSKTPGEFFGSWSTPVVAKIGGREELIQSWPGVVKSYNPANGEVLWSCKGLEKDRAADRLTYTSPLVTQDVVVAMAGYGGAAIAVRTGGTGDVTETHRLWRHPSNPQRIGSGVIVGEHVYMVNETGVAQCIELKTGKVLWNERIGDRTWSSLVYADGKLWIITLSGDTIVFAPNPKKLEVLARNALKEHTMASLAVADGRLYLRTHEALWCIGKK